MSHDFHDAADLLAVCVDPWKEEPTFQRHKPATTTTSSPLPHFFSLYPRTASLLSGTRLLHMLSLQYHQLTVQLAPPPPPLPPPVCLCLAVSV